MPALHIFQQIDRCVLKVAVARGVSPNSRKFHEPLRPLQYRNQLGRWSPPDGSFPTRKMQRGYWEQVREALRACRTDAGARILSHEDFRLLDQAYRHYEETVTPVPEQVPESWYELVEAEKLSRFDLADPKTFMSMLYRRLYEPMLQGDKGIFEQNYRIIRPAVLLKDSLLPQGEERYWPLRELLAVCAAFCFYRFADPREEEWLAEMRRMFRHRKSGLIMATLLGHDYFNNPHGFSASHAMKLAIDGVDTSWAGYFGAGVDMGRAALSAIARGHDLDETQRCLDGMSAEDAIARHRDACVEKGHVFQSLFFQAASMRAHGKKGRLEKVLDTTSHLRHQASKAGYRVPILEQLVNLVESEAYFVAYRGEANRYLLEAGEKAALYFAAHESGNKARPRIDEMMFLQRLFQTSLDKLGTTAHIERTEMSKAVAKKLLEFA